jgi:molybdopterin-containing oxidoreductase family membrane subunit
MDVGKPWRALSMIYSPNFKSLFVWDFYFLAISVILALVYLLRSQSRNVVVLAGAASTVLMIVEGWILTVTAGTALWHNSLIPVVFLIEGLVTALALVVLRKGVGLAVGQMARRGLLLLLPILFVLSFVEMVATLYGADVEAAEAMRILVAGAVAPWYWLALIVGVALPFGLLGWAANGVNTLRVASVLAILGVFSAKLNLLVAGRSVPFMQPEASYGPSLVEVGGVIGALGFAALLFLLGRRYLPGLKEV